MDIATFLNFWYFNIVELSYHQCDAKFRPILMSSEATPTISCLAHLASRGRGERLRMYIICNVFPCWYVILKAVPPLALGYALPTNGAVPGSYRRSGRARQKTG